MGRGSGERRDWVGGQRRGLGMRVSEAAEEVLLLSEKEAEHAVLLLERPVCIDARAQPLGGLFFLLYLSLSRPLRAAAILQ